jgi:hypothetical protein
MEEEGQAPDVRGIQETQHRSCVAFAELLQEWAEVPVEGPEALAWGAALAYEMTAGFWRGCNVRVLSAENVLYRMLISDRISASPWRNRTHDLGERARQLATTIDLEDTSDE